jgi:hypothetical protein
VTDSDNDDVGVFLEDDAPVADPQSGSGASPQPFDITFSGGGELRQTRIDPPPNIVRKLEPLSRGGRCEENLLHAVNIAYCDNGSSQYRESR